MTETTVIRKLQTVWSDFTVKDESLYSTQLELSTTIASESLKDLCLNFFGNYSGFNGTAYGEGFFDLGLTEQESYDYWQKIFNEQQALAKKQLINAGITTIPQSVYDGLILLHWVTKRVLTVINKDVTYDLTDPLLQQKYDIVADMIFNSSDNKALCRIGATVLRLADYGRPKSRTWQRSNGVFKLRDFNEKGILTTDQLKRARFSYYAETLNFLPFTPEGLQRQIVKEYETSLVVQNFTFSGTNTFTLERAPAMTPQEKIKVFINDAVQQHFYDFTVDGFTLTISKAMNTGDIVRTIIKI
jgi:hypothetical protein